MIDPAHTYQLEDLEHWPSGNWLAVLGQPVKHSLSPLMHAAALHCLAQTLPWLRSWRYVKIEVPPERLPEALPLLAQKGFRGLNLTLPHKVEALGLIDEVHPGAALMGALNTLHLRPQGGYAGYNTDGFGLLQGLARDLNAPVAGRPVVLLGAGGAARAAAVACLQKQPTGLFWGNRTLAKLEPLLEAVREAFPQAALTPFSPSEPPAFPDNAIFINATSLGLKPDDPSPLPDGLLRPGHAIYDMTYGCANALQQQAIAAGARYADGLSMLVWQGARALGIWTGVEVPAQPMLDALCHHQHLPYRHA